MDRFHPGLPEGLCLNRSLSQLNSPYRSILSVITFFSELCTPLGSQMVLWSETNEKLPIWRSHLCLSTMHTVVFTVIFKKCPIYLFFCTSKGNHCEYDLILNSVSNIKIKWHALPTIQTYFPDHGLK